MKKRMQKKLKNVFFDIWGLEKSDYQDPDEVKKNSFNIDRQRRLRSTYGKQKSKIEKNICPARKGGCP